MKVKKTTTLTDCPLYPTWNNGLHTWDQIITLRQNANPWEK